MAPKGKIFIGLEDISSLIGDFTVGFNLLGFDVFSVVHNKHPINSSNYSIVLSSYLPPITNNNLNQQKLERAQLITKLKEKIFKYAIEECDIFIFIVSSFFPDYSDLPILKSLGKKIIFIFLGSDCRWESSFNQEMALYKLSPLAPGVNDGYAHLIRVTRRLCTAELFADAIFNTPSQAGLALRPYYDVLAYPIDTTNYPTKTRQKDIPVVLHAPSDRLKKGSDSIDAIFLQLKQDGLDFIPQVLEGIPHKKILKMYQNVDMLAGQMGAVTGGKQERELMACGKIVISGITYKDYPQKLPPEYPNVPGHSTQEMYMALKALIPNTKLRQKIANLGPKYIHTYHDPATTCEKYLNVLYNHIEPDFIPSFFRDTFIPEQEYLTIYNLRIKIVQNCPWYKQYINPGNRVGLSF